MSCRERARSSTCEADGVVDAERLPEADVAAWQAGVGCSSRDAAARDLLLTRLAVAVSSHPDLRDELLLRGGFALHRLALPAPMRCCVALEYARLGTTAIGPLLDALREIGSAAGFAVRTEVRALPRVYLTHSWAPKEGHTRLRIDLETRETEPMRPPVRRQLAVSTEWFTGDTTLLTYDTEELVGLALRELYRRSRSRDLFDVWAALTRLEVDDAIVLSTFRSACDLAHIGRVPRGRFVARLHRHLARPAFLRDVDGLAGAAAREFEPRRAAALVTERLLARLPP